MIMDGLINVFLNVGMGQDYVHMAVQLTVIVFFAEFVTIFLSEATNGYSGDLNNVGKVFEYIVKLFLIAESLPMIMKLFELILSIL